MQIREYHRRHPAARDVSVNDDYEQLLKEEPQIEFTGEVSHSACLSLCLHLFVDGFSVFEG